ncbi:MAG TPA: alpha/beta hydrolase-fold protein [bacterium]|nr:alpha/beta hydrolase-fold protein [bacterium]
MRKQATWFGLGAAAVVAALLMIGCTEHESPLGPPTLSSKQPVTTTFSFDAQLDRNSAEDRDSRRVTVVYASDEPPTIPQAPFPVLYLLHDFQGDAGYFERYGLQTLVDEMYKNGEIGRMLIVTVDASNYFGGSYYRNSATTGRYEDMLDALIDNVEFTYKVHTQGGRAARAISGQGMGGYGAMRFALDHADMFSSVSSMSGPLSLGDPNAGTGVWHPTNGIVHRVFQENGTGPGDPQLYAKLTAGFEVHAETRNFLAMASAFSPHPLRVFDSLGMKLVPKFPFIGRYDTLYNQEFYSPRPAGANTLSFDSQVDTFGVGVDVIFDSNGAISEPVWALWRDSADVKNVFVAKRAQDPQFWNDLDIYIDVGLENEYGYLEQNRDFHQTLTQAGVAHTYIEYEGSGSIRPGHSDLLLTRLREVIKFHSERLVRPAGPQ